MNIIPKPKKIIQKNGFFEINRETRLTLDNNCGFSEMDAALLIKAKITELAGFTPQVIKSLAPVSAGTVIFKKTSAKNEKYKLNISENTVVIEGGKKGIFYGVQTLLQLLSSYKCSLPAMEITDYPDFENRAFYYDISRGKVPKTEEVKRLLKKMAYYKLNQLQLYIEHTFMFDNQSEVWTGKDPLTQLDILELDKYAKSLHIELVPSLSTFGHLFMQLSSDSFKHLCELENYEAVKDSLIERNHHHTLNPKDEKSFEFIKDMLDEFIPLFSSDKFNICCDETFDLGKGKSAAACEKHGAGKVYIDFVNKIISHVKAHGKKVMMWGDIILSHPEILKDLPKDVTILTWNYSENPDKTKAQKIYESGYKQYLCPGTSSWYRLFPDCNTAFENIKKMVSFAKEYKAHGILNTCWGDYGHTSLTACAVPAMIYGGALSWNYTEDDLDYAISFLEYGDIFGEIMELLRKISKTEVVLWRDIVRWYEVNFKNLGYFKEINSQISALDADAVYNAAIIINRHLEKLKAFSSDSLLRDKTDFNELYLCAEGSWLLHALSLIIIKYQFKKDVKIIFEPKVLAEKIEKWFSGYIDAYRNRNREGELSLVADLFKGLTGFLRNL